MSYPKIQDNNFQKKINTKFKKHTIPKKKKSFNEICYPKEYTLQIPQKFLADYINPKTPYKGILIVHRIGSGKTCTAVNIGEQWKHKRNIVVVVPASLKGNFRDELRSMCANEEYLTNKERKQLNTLHPSSNEYKDIIDKSDQRIDKYYSIYSYNTFIELAVKGKMKLDKSVLIVDEIQNMVSESGIYYKVLYKTIHKAPSNLRVVLMSATPMYDKPVELALTMNLLRIPFELPTGREFDKTFIETKIIKGKKVKTLINEELLKERIKGYVSYYRGAPPHVFPESTIKYVNAEMSDFQYRSYLTILDKEQRELRKKQGFDEGEIKKLPTNFFLGSRLISNISFPNKMINEKGFKSFEGKYLKMQNLEKYSTKFYQIMKKVHNAHNPVFIYSNFVGFGGLKSLVKVLDAHGYKDYAKEGEGKNRYALWTGSETSKYKSEIKAVFNQQTNQNGSKLKIILGSDAISVGVSLFNVRQVHILEPYWNLAKLEQIIGRAIRYCSHKGLPTEKRNVKVYIYLATHPNEKMTIDKYIKQTAEEKDTIVKQFERVIKESAIDCTLFKNGNELGGDRIKCDV